MRALHSAIIVALAPYRPVVMSPRNIGDGTGSRSARFFIAGSQ
jgi:hypothetical protein